MSKHSKQKTEWPTKTKSKICTKHSSFLAAPFFNKVATRPRHRGKAPHAHGILMQPAATVQHHAQGPCGSGFSRQGGPKNGICHVEQIVKQTLTTFTSNMITMKTPMICSIQTWIKMIKGVVESCIYKRKKVIVFLLKWANSIEVSNHIFEMH